MKEKRMTKALLYAFLLPAAAWDFKYRKVPNALIGAAAAAGVLCEGTVFLGRFVPAFLLLSCLHGKGLLGGGDLKTLAILFGLSGTERFRMAVFSGCLLCLFVKAVPAFFRDRPVPEAFPFVPWLLAGTILSEFIPFITEKI